MTGIELIGLARISDREHQNTQQEPNYSQDITEHQSSVIDFVAVG